MRIRRLIIVAVLAGLAGCQSLPPLNFSVPNVGYSQKKIDAELKSLTVTVARPDEKKGDLPAGVETITQYWQTAMTEGLNKMAIFRDDAPEKVNISAKILAVDAPSFGIAMETKTIARYEIIDRANGDIIYTRDIEAIGHVPGDYAFAGFIRVRESVNRSVQNNIAQFLQDLDSVDLSKPMFPATSVQK